MNKFLLFFLIVFTISACTDKNETPVVVFDVEDEFSIRLKENLNINGRDIAFEISSLAGYNCEDVVLDTEFSRTNDGGINIYIHDLIIPNNCTEGNTIPKQELTIGELDNGTYNINITLRNVVINLGELIISEESYVLSFENELKGIVLDAREVLKIPEGFIWGRVEVNNDNANFLLDAFKNKLNNTGAIESFLAIGQYSSFEMSNTGELLFENSSEFNYSFPFVYNYGTQNTEGLNGIVQSFLSDYNNTYDLDIDLFTYDGKEF